MNPSQSAITQWNWSFYAVLTRDISIFVTGVRVFRDMEGVLIRGWDLILPECGETSTLARGATLAARWLHDQSARVELGFPHRAWRYRPGGSPFSFPGCWICRGMEGYLIRDGTLSSSGAAGPQRCPEGQLAGSPSLSQSATSQLSWGFHTVRGDIGPRISVFIPGLM